MPLKYGNNTQENANPRRYIKKIKAAGQARRRKSKEGCI